MLTLKHGFLELPCRSPGSGIQQYTWVSGNEEQQKALFYSSMVAPT